MSLSSLRHYLCNQQQTRHKRLIPSPETSAPSLISNEPGLALGFCPGGEESSLGIRSLTAQSCLCQRQLILTEQARLVVTDGAQCAWAGGTGGAMADVIRLAHSSAVIKSVSILC